MRKLRFIRRLIVAGFLAGMLGMAIGNLVDTMSTKVHATQRFVENEIDCLGKAIFNEARGENAGVKRWIGIVVIARRDDPSRKWPNTVCGNAFQKNAFSGIEKLLAVGNDRVWSDVRGVAEEVYHAAWKQQLLPRGWGCVRYFKVSDERLAKLGPKQLKQLGITSGSGLEFFKKLRHVDTRGSVSFYENPRDCSPLPTT